LDSNFIQDGEKMRVLFLIISLCTVSFGVVAAEPPDWFISLRDAIYEQNLAADDVVPLYKSTLHEAETQLSGHVRFTVLSRCEYMMGRALLYEGRKKEAEMHYEKGREWAKKSLDESATAEGYQMLAENISQLCTVRTVFWVMANGLDVEEYAEEALKLDPRNAAAQYMIAARYVYAPAPFYKYNKGIDMMMNIENNADLQRDDRFNVYSAIGYAYIQQKKYQEARPWLEKALAIYPSNKFVRGLLEQKG
jgi:tetratricopeptide (TPR) repeat protein